MADAPEDDLSFPRIAIPEKKDEARGQFPGHRPGSFHDSYITVQPEG
jgi:hypothetical protein